MDVQFLALKDDGTYFGFKAEQLVMQAVEGGTAIGFQLDEGFSPLITFPVTVTPIAKPEPPADVLPFISPTEV